VISCSAVKKGIAMVNVWREHPKLKDHFLPDHPDDLQVIVHDGGPRTTQNSPEAVWVTVTGIDGEVFQGRLLNQPHRLQSVHKGSEIKFVMPAGSKHPIMVTDKYLRERGAWVIHPCQKCGLSELFDAPSDLIRVIFPSTLPDAVMCMFTAFCPLCGGVQGVESRSLSDTEGGKLATSAPAKRPWWKFWG
jgi:hypothetical protein